MPREGEQIREKPDSASGPNPVEALAGFSLLRLFTKLLFHV